MKEFKKVYREKELRPPSDIVAKYLSETMKALPPSDIFDTASYYFLRCASQNVGSALMAIEQIKKDSLRDDWFNMAVVLDFDYDPDEWSLESHIFDFDKKILLICKIHSEGA